MKKYFFIALILIIVVLGFKFGPGFKKYLEYNSEYNTALAYAKKLDGTTKTFELKPIFTESKKSFRDFTYPNNDTIGLAYFSLGYNIEGAPKLMYVQAPSSYTFSFNKKEQQNIFVHGTFNYKIGPEGIMGYIEATD